MPENKTDAPRTCPNAAACPLGAKPAGYACAARVGVMARDESGQQVEIATACLLLRAAHVLIPAAVTVSSMEALRQPGTILRLN